MLPSHKTNPEPCPYLEGHTAVNRIILSESIDPENWATLLETGWRRFGYLFFRPDCPDCRKCRPIRIPVNRFIPSSNQKRVLRKNQTAQYIPRNIRRMLSGTPSAEERDQILKVWQIYQKHSETRFGICKEDWQGFVETFFTPSVETLFCTLITEGQISGSGFLDLSPGGTSSIYFSFDPAYSYFSPGTFSILKEIEMTRELSLDYYYLGYWIPECKAMAYKARFRPHEIYDWETGTWAPPLF